MDAKSFFLRLLDEYFAGPAWHGTTLLGSVRGLGPEEALWRPAPERNCIWDLVLHSAYWKYAAWRRLTGARRGSFARPGSNFPELPDDPTAKAWKADVQLLRDEHTRLREAVAALPGPAFDRRSASSKWTNASLIWGIAAHDVYHAGQIQLLKRLRQGGTG
jgi:uncharacterized damage-inducible protein DinB